VKRGYSNGTIQHVLTYNQPIVDNIDNSKIDAAAINGTHMFFIQGNKTVYWDPYKRNKRVDRLPTGELVQSLNTTIAFPGLENKDQRILTAFKWPYDGRLYVFQGKYFYIWDESKQALDGMYKALQWYNVCKVNICRHGQTPKCITPETMVAPVYTKKKLIVSI